MSQLQPVASPATAPALGPPGAPSGPPPGGPPMPVFNLRLAMGLLGVLIAAVMAGLSNRVGALTLADMRGVLGWGADDGAWLNSVYLAGELVAMPFSCWLALTFSLRRFHMTVVTLFALLAWCLPWVHSWELLLGLRAMQGLLGGLLIPVLMMSALRFLPPPIRLHGLALYALTATFSPNLAFWVAGQWTDVLFDWRLVYWQSLPLALLSLCLVSWGIPQDPVRLERLRQANWFGLVCACVGLSLLALGLDRGARLDWWRSDLICWLIGAGSALTAVYLLSEWHHPSPFVKPQLLGIRNLGLGFGGFVPLLIVLLSASLLPAMHLERVWGYRALQTAPIGLIVALPQLLLGSLVALLLYRKWVDARYVYVGGLLFIALACVLSAGLSGDWVESTFVYSQMLHALGQPMAVVSMLFLCTSVVRPIDGPYVAGIVNTIRAFSTLFGGAVLGHFLVLRERFHSDVLQSQSAYLLEPVAGLADISEALRTQAFVLAAADSYWLLAALALLLIPLVLCMDYVPAPLSAAPKATAPSTPAALAMTVAATTSLA